MLVVPSNNAQPTLPLASKGPRADLIAALDAGHFLQQSTPQTHLICMDGRPDEEGERIGVSLPGGGAMAAMAAAKTLRFYGRPFSWQQLVEVSVPCVRRFRHARVHGDQAHSDNSDPHSTQATTAETTASGCGALDLFHVSSMFMADNERAMRRLYGALGGEKYPDDLVGEGAWGPCGADFLTMYRRLDATTRILSGSHQEEMVVFNRRSGWVVDRQAVVDQFGSVQVFCVDAWAMPEVEHMAAGIIDSCWGEEPINPGAPEAVRETILLLTCACIIKLCPAGTPIVCID